MTEFHSFIWSNNKLKFTEYLPVTGIFLGDTAVNIQRSCSNGDYLLVRSMWGHVAWWVFEICLPDIHSPFLR